MDVQLLSCPGCGIRHTVEEVFEHCTASWPEHLLLYFDCPKCRHRRHVQVHDDCVSLGYLDGVPGPRFVAQQQVVQPGLVSSASEEGMELELLERCWFIEARE